MAKYQVKARFRTTVDAVFEVEAASALEAEGKVYEDLSISDALSNEVKDEECVDLIDTTEVADE